MGMNRGGSNKAHSLRQPPQVSVTFGNKKYNGRNTRQIQEEVRAAGSSSVQRTSRISPNNLNLQLGQNVTQDNSSRPASLRYHYDIAALKQMGKKGKVARGKANGQGPIVYKSIPMVTLAPEIDPPPQKITKAVVMSRQKVYGSKNSSERDPSNYDESMSREQEKLVDTLSSEKRNAVSSLHYVKHTEVSKSREETNTS